MDTQHVLERVQEVAQLTTVSGATGAVFFGLTASEFAAFLGVGVALIGVVVNSSINFYFKYKAHQLEVYKAKRNE